jgi:hypothetical protein
MYEFLSGAVTLGHFIGALFFLRFWRKTRDRLFLAFSAAFILFGFNQGLAHILAIYHEPTSFIYALRVLGFVLILVAIVDKNMLSGNATAAVRKR